MTTAQHGAVLRDALAHLQAGRFGAATALCRPLADDTSDVDACLILGLALGGMGDVAHSSHLLAAVAHARPAHAHPVCDLSALLRRHGTSAAADAHFRAALRHRPDDARLRNAYAAYQLSEGHPERAAAELEDWLARSPGDGSARNTLGLALIDLHRQGDALAEFRRAVAYDTANAAAWSNLGKALVAQGEFEPGLAALAEAGRLWPQDARIKLNHAIALLKAGRWMEGWAAFECRLAQPGGAVLPEATRLRSLSGLTGRTVLLTHEEGFGDTLQCIRYAAVVAAKGARVLAWVPPELGRLVSTVPGVAGVVTSRSLPAFDAHCPMLSLPGLCGTTVATVPSSARYLRLEPGWCQAWAGRLGPATGLRVGIAWSGAARPGTEAGAIDRQRSLSSAAITPLASLPGVQWVSLQFGAVAPPWMLDLMPHVRDFADTAGLVASLDAVVTVDTAVAHVAGGMGYKVVLLDRYDNCWRWLSGRPDSPWYAGLRILRQTQPGDWAGVLARVRAELGV